MLAPSSQSSSSLPGSLVVAGASPSPLRSRLRNAVQLPLLLTRSRPVQARMKESEARYAPVDSSNPGGKDGSNGDSGAISRSKGQQSRESGHALMEDTFYLQNVGHVSVTLSATHLLWHLIEDDKHKLDPSALLCWRNSVQDAEGQLSVAEIFAVNSSGAGPVSKAKVVVNEKDPSSSKQVFVNPYGGKGSGVQTWKRLASLFELAKISATVIKTERAGHARDVMDAMTQDELNAVDGVVVVGGDGFFNEVLNGLVVHRHKAQSAIMPQRLNSIFEKKTFLQKRNAEVSNEKRGLKSLLGKASDPYSLRQDRSFTSNTDAALSQESKKLGPGSDTNSRSGEFEIFHNDATIFDTSDEEGRGQADNRSVFLTVPMEEEEQRDELFTEPTEPVFGRMRNGDGTESPGHMSDIELDNPNTTLSNSNPSLRIGIIPAGSTDTVVVSTTGTRDPITSALHIILGDSMPLDIVRITAWKNHPEASPNEKPEVRYAASFAGYGFYGDVMKESEDLRWMGPARYDIAGAMVFLKHKAYDAEISFLDIPQDKALAKQIIPQGPWIKKRALKSSKKKILCLANCVVCAKGFDFSSVINSDSDTDTVQQAPTWKTCRSKFHSIGAAVMSCRNEKAPEGVAAHAHLADGLLHLILVRECSRPDYLRQLLRLARRGADPFDFSFVEHHKTPLFTFLSQGDKESVWNVDGELLPARQLTGQVFRGLVTLFARGPET